jgi:hypothetical protein
MIPYQTPLSFVTCYPLKVPETVTSLIREFFQWQQSEPESSEEEGVAK